ncbi:MAG: cytochrome c biogenesis protein [Desulfovibrio sp.]|jgi:ABC-type uncharacterized transport system permease subunit|nr:cytochrome c biogenesis protein [Desulfovibrio sp.]
MEYKTLLFIAVIFCYSLGALGIVLGTLARRPAVKSAANLLTLAGFALHSVFLLKLFLEFGPRGLSAAYHIQLLAWCLILFYLAAWRWLRYPFLGMTAAPLAMLLSLFSLQLAGLRDILPRHLSGLFFGLHIWSLYISIGMLTMAFGAGLLFVYTESKIKNKIPLAEFTKDMPSLSTYDRVNSVAVMAGFPFYTLGLMSGFIWAPMTRSVVENPKVILSLFIWFLYALLFYQRAAIGYRGRKTAVMAIVIFGISALSLVFDYAVSHHSLQLMP